MLRLRYNIVPKYLYPQHRFIMAVERTDMGEITLNPADEAILDELVAENQSVPARLADQTGYDRQYVHKRLKRLSEHEIVESLSHGLYRLKDDPR